MALKIEDCLKKTATLNARLPKAIERHLVAETKRRMETDTDPDPVIALGIVTELRDLVEKDRTVLVEAMRAKENPATGATGDGVDTTGSREPGAGSSTPAVSGLAESDTKAPEVKPALTPALQRLAALRSRLPGGEVRSQALEDPAFYSQLGKTIGEKMPARATAAQIRGIVTNPQNRVKAEELKWTGLLPWVEAQQQPVSRDAVMEYLRGEGAVKFEEVSLAKERNREALNNYEAFSAELVRRHPEWQYDDGWTDAEIDAFDRRTLTGPEYFQWTAAKAKLGNAVNDRTRYSQYQLPGGENYREVVVSHSATIQPPDMSQWEKSDARYNLEAPGGGMKVVSTQEWKMDHNGQEFQIIFNPLKNKYVLRADYVHSQGAAGNVSNAHFDSLDTAVRAAEMVIRKERLVVGAAEGGYRSNHFPDVPNYVAHMRVNERTDTEGRPGLFLEELQSDRHQRGRDKGYKGESALSHEDQKEYDRLEAIHTTQRSAEEQRLVENFRTKIGEHLEGVPDAPFRTAWPLQLFKRALRDAVSAGKQWIGWTTGDTQAERYDLSKQIRGITWDNIDGQGRQIQIKVQKIGESRYQDIGIFEAEKLPDVVGKDMADRILSKARNGMEFEQITGLDLKVGGEGMKAFYDKILPSEIGKYVKQWGAQVSTSKISEENTPIWRVEITPAMAAGVRKGQAVFSQNFPDVYSRDIPRSEVAELRDIAEALHFDDGIDTPEKLAAAMNTLGFRDLTENVWNGIRAIKATLPASPDWQAIYTALDKPAGIVQDSRDEQSLEQRPGSADSGDAEGVSPVPESTGGQRGGETDGNGTGASAGDGGGRDTQGMGATPAGSGRGNTRGGKGGRTTQSSERPGDSGNGSSERVAATENYVITPEDRIGEGPFTVNERFADNIAAIRLVKELEAQDRKPTVEEQRVLVKYVGWGGMKQAFNGSKKEWAARYAELKSLLTPEEYAAANSSIQDAHYTSPTVITDGIYAALERFGFTGGKMVEGGVGIGHFIGLMPAGMRQASSYLGVERDTITAKIAGYLYPKAAIYSKGYEEADLAPGSFDGAAGNPPFGEKKIFDKRFKHLSKFSIHNYFIAKTLELLRPGAVAGFVVSHNFLDALDPTAREYIASKADFLGAIRLPNTAFKGNANTEVVTDLVFFKRTDEETDKGWTRSTQNPVPGTDAKFSLNSWIAGNPQMTLGAMDFIQGMYGPNEMTVKPTGDLSKQLAAAVKRLPENVYRANDAETQERLTTPEAVTPDDVKVGGFFVRDGKVFRRLPDYNMERQEQAQDTLPEATAERVKGMVGVRDALNALVRAELRNDTSPATLDALRAALNDTYDAFVKKHGFLNQQANRRAFYDDPEAARVLGLESDFMPGISKTTAAKKGVPMEKPTAKKAAIFTKRVNAPYTEITSAGTAVEALAVSMNQRGSVLPAYMAELTGKPVEDVLDELDGLIFEDPESLGYELAAKYLSGNVFKKLQAARAAGPRFEKNVKALEAAMPAPIEALDIIVPPGAPWVPAGDMNQFAQDLTGEPFGTAVYNAATGGWLTRHPGTSDAASTTWGTRDMDFGELWDAIINGKAIQVYDGRGDDKVLNQEKTTLALAKADEIRQKWEQWIWDTEERRDRLAKVYNELVNVYVDAKYDGSHLTLPGASALIKLRPHQKNVAWRIMTDLSALLDHVVGAGKTFAGIAAFQELRRLGRVRKPLFVVPNHLVTQWRDDFIRLYPNANILFARPSDFQKAKRKQMFAKIMTGDYDAVILGHSSLKKIGVGTETERALLMEMREEMVEAARLMAAADGGQRAATQLQKQIDKLDAKLARLADAGQKDDVATFEELGIDGVFVDEAHEFKNLYYTTQMQRVAGLGDPAGSDKAFDLYLKTRYLRQRYGENAPVVFATGTPLSNSLVEMFTMQRYLQPQVLASMGAKTLDAWARIFASVQQVYEVDPTGTGMRLSTRFATFQNAGELSAVYRTVADVITMSDLRAQAEAEGLRWPVPKVAGGKPEVVAVPRSKDQENYFGVEYDTGATDSEGEPIMAYPEGTICYRVDHMPDDPSEDNMLKLTSDARKAGLDMRLVDEKYPDHPDSKINTAVKKIAGIWEKWKERKGTQLVFCDLSTPKSAKSKPKKKPASGDLYWTVDGQGGLKVVKKAEPITFEARPDDSFFIYQDKPAKVWRVVERNSGKSILSDADRDGLVIRLQQLLPGVSQEQWDRVTGQRPDPDTLAEFISENTAQDEAATDEADNADDSTEEVSLDALMAGTGDFSVYDDMKAKLIAAGVPENEIAFIHDYDSGEKKAKLFADMNAGKVRILFGSTPKLGAGTNVQKRLVALHHMDAPWRPSDLEQREGRIIRQGNLFYEEDPDGFEVDVVRYATKQTYDTRMWQLIESKALGIEGFRKADRTTRIVKDISGEAANASEMKAAASGDPLIQEEIQLRQEVEKLQLLQRGFNSNKHRVQSELRFLEGAEDRRDSAVRDMERRIALRDANEPVFKLSNGKEFIKPEGVAKDIVKILEAVSKSKLADGVSIGTYRGFTLMAEHFRSMGKDGIAFYLEMPGVTKPNHRATDYLLQDDEGNPTTIDSGGFAKRLANYLASFEKSITRAQDEAAQQVERIPAMRKAATEDFSRAGELKAMMDRHAVVRQQLTANRSRRNNAAASQAPKKGPALRPVTAPDPELMTDDVRAVLRRSKVSGLALTLPEQLDPKLYKKVNAAIESAGGVWDKYAKAHIFAGDPSEVLGIDGTVRTQDPEAWERSHIDFNDELDEIEAAMKAGKPTGNPELAYSMAGDQVRVMDEWLKNAPQTKETHAQWEEEATWLENAMGGKAAAWDALLEKMQRGDMLTARETKLADRYLVANERNLGTVENKDRARAFAEAYRRSRSEVARALGSGVDQFMKPAERWRRFLFNTAITPDEGARKAATEARKSGEDGTPAQKDAARRRANKIEDDASRKALERVEAALAKNGFTLDEFLNTDVKIQPSAPVFMRLTREMAEWKRGVMAKLQGGDVPFKSIAKQLGRTEKEVRAVRQEFEDKFRAFALANMKPGMTADDLLKLAGAAGVVRSQAVGDQDAAMEAVIREAMMKMGLVPEDKQGKARVKERRSGTREQISPDEAARRIMARWQDRNKRNASAVGEASKAYARAKDMTDDARDAFQSKLEALGVSRANAAAMATEAQERLKASRMGTKEKFITYLDLEDAEAVVAAARDMQAGRGDVIDMAMEYLYFSMLSGPKTQVVNLASYPLTIVGDMGVTRGIAAFLNTAFGWFGAGNSMAPQLGEFGAMLKAALPGIADGFRLAAKSWKTGVDFLAYDKLHDKAHGDTEDVQKMIKSMSIEIPRAAIPRALGGDVFRSVFKGMQFVDVLGKTTIAHMEVAAWALRIARKEIKGQTFATKQARMEALEARVAELVGTPGSEAWKQAIAAATEAGFQTPLEGGPVPNNSMDRVERTIAGMLARIDKALTSPGLPGVGGFIGKAVRSIVKLLVLAFVRTPFNITRIGLRKTPLGSIPFLARFIEAGGAHLFGDRTFSEVFPKFFPNLAEQVIAFLGAALIWGAVEGDDDDDEKWFLITGGPLPGRGDREENMTREAATGGNFIIRIGGKDGIKIPFGRYEPIATVLGTTTDMIRSAKMDHATAGERMHRLASGLMGQVEEKTFLRGVADMIQVIDDVRHGNGDATQRWGMRVASMVVPNIIKAPIRDSDPFIRDYRTADPMYQFLPLPKYAQPKVSPITGNPIEKEGNGWIRTFVPTATKTDNLPDYAKAVLNYNSGRASGEFDKGGSWAPGTPDTKLRGHPALPRGSSIALKPDVYTYLSGGIAKETARRLAGRISPEMARNPDMEMIKLIKAEHEKAGDTVRDFLRRTPPDKLGTVSLPVGK